MPCHVELTQAEKDEPYKEIQTLTRLLCFACGQIDKTGTSLENIELYKWWIKHQDKDKERIKKEALNKLTPEEKKVLGLC